MNPRTIAAQILQKVISQKRSLTQLLSDIPSGQKEISLVKALCFGTLRWYFTLTPLLPLLLAKPLKAKDGDIQALLLIGFYQIIYLQTPPNLAVTQTVEAARDLKKPWATGLVNAVLRNFLRQQASLLRSSADLCQQFAHPHWFIFKLQQAWPEHWQAILAANNEHPPLSIRVNTRRISKSTYLEQLSAQNIPATEVSHVPAGIMIKTPCPIDQLPGFTQGWFSVQDCAAQLAAPLLELSPNQRILDACAAPGGKTLHILELQPNIASLTAVDINEEKLKWAKDNWVRLQLPNLVQWIVADVTKTLDWWDKIPFDRILLDAPCSATGVIRRHPDIKLLRRPEDIALLQNQQATLLETLWPLLGANGLLLYTTCSVLPEENEQVILNFLKKHADAIEEKIVFPSPIDTKIGIQIPTGFNGMDGFYYARLRKNGRIA